MGSKTKIDWCDSTWNPVTGCLHECEYCYARRIAERFSTREKYERPYEPVLHVPVRRVRNVPEPYPYGFQPTFHRYKLEAPSTGKSPATSLFARWQIYSGIGCRTSGSRRFSRLARKRRSIGICSSPKIQDGTIRYWTNTCLRTCGSAGLRRGR